MLALLLAAPTIAGAAGFEEVAPVGAGDVDVGDILQFHVLTAGRIEEQSLNRGQAVAGFMGAPDLHVICLSIDKQVSGLLAGD